MYTEKFEAFLFSQIFLKCDMFLDEKHPVKILNCHTSKN